VVAYATKIFFGISFEMLRYLSEGKRQQNIGTEISLFRGYFLSFLFLFGE